MAFGDQFVMMHGISTTRKSCVVRLAFLMRPMLQLLRALVKEVGGYGWTMSSVWVMKVL